MKVTVFLFVILALVFVWGMLSGLFENRAAAVQGVADARGFQIDNGTFELYLMRAGVQDEAVGMCMKVRGKPEEVWVLKEGIPFPLENESFILLKTSSNSQDDASRAISQLTKEVSAKFDFRTVRVHHCDVNSSLLTDLLENSQGTYELYTLQDVLVNAEIRKGKDRFFGIANLRVPVSGKNQEVWCLAPGCFPVDISFAAEFLATDPFSSPTRPSENDYVSYVKSRLDPELQVFDITK